MDYQSKEASRSRISYLIQCAFEYFITLFITDSMLSVLLTSQGFSDSAVGVISSMTSLAFLFQLVSVPFVHRVTNVKRFAVIFHITAQILFSTLYLIPFLPFAADFRRPLMVASILIANFCSYFVRSLLYRWANSFVEPKKLGLYSANKEMVSLISGIVVQFLIGYIMDEFKFADNLEGGFIFAAVMILVFAACDFLCLYRISAEKTTTKAYNKTPTRVILKETLGRKSYRATLYQLTMWQIAHYASLGFVGVYKNNDLLLSLTLIQVINIASALARFALSRPLGKFADKHSFCTGANLGMCIAIAGFVFLMFTTPSTWWLIIPYQLCYHVSLAGTNANFHNIAYQSTDPKYYTEASAIMFSISGVIGFLVSILSGWILGQIQNNGNMILGMHIYGQQLLALISLVFTLMSVLYTVFVIQKMPTFQKKED